MIRALPFVCLLGVLLAGGPVRADGPGNALAPETRVFVEIVAPERPIYAGEVVRIGVRIGYDEAFLRKHAVALFARDVDLPLALHLSWWTGTPGLAPRPGAVAAGPGGGTRRLALGDVLVDGVVRAPVERGGRRYARLEVRRRFRLERAGRLTLARPAVRFAYATRFEAGFLDDRVPVDRRLVRVAGEPRTLDVRPLPAEGRPPGFRGAVGRFALHVEVDPPRVPVGGSLRATLRIEGEGDLEGVPAPDAGDFPGFRLVGLLDDHAGPPRRTLRYELAPVRAGRAALPALRLPCFDPTPPARYRIVESAPVPIEVVGPPPAPEANGSGPRATAGRAPGNGTRRPPAPATPSLPPGWLGAGLLALVGLGILGWRLRRAAARAGARRAGQPAGTDRAEPHALADARARLRAALAGTRDDLERALTGFLAARLGCRPAAVPGPGLAGRLARAGLDPGAAAEVAALLDALVAARYGGPPPPVPSAALETALRGCAGGPPER